MPDRVIRRHDTAQQPRVKFLDEFGVALTGLSTATIRYTLTNIATGVVKINRATAVAADQGTYPGEAYYQLLSGDVDTSGTYQEEWEITYQSGAKESFPVGLPQYVRIIDDQDNT